MSSQMVELPAYPTARDMPGLLRCASQFIAAEPNGVVCDGHNVKFVDPCGMAVLGCIAEKFRANGASLDLIGFSEGVLSYLSRMDAFGDFIDRGVELGPRLDRGDALLEVTRIEAGEDRDNAARRLVASLLGGMSDLPENEEPDDMTGMTRRNSVEEPLEYIFTELLDNVFQHGRKYGFDASAWVCAQYYPKQDTVRFAIVDNGCGYLRSLGEHPDLAERTDIEAIRLALRERTSCNPALLLRGSDHSANQGVGLTVVSRIIEKANGRMWIASGDASLEVGANQVKQVAPWQGCVLAVEVSRTELMKIRVHQVIATLHGGSVRPNLDFS